MSKWILFIGALLVGSIFISVLVDGFAMLIGYSGWLTYVVCGFGGFCWGWFLCESPLCPWEDN